MLTEVILIRVSCTSRIIANDVRYLFAFHKLDAFIVYENKFGSTMFQDIVNLGNSQTGAKWTVRFR